ncbi:hypothetical protein BH10PSE2_BH10PSE2_16800 [soil metagenome]
MIITLEIGSVLSLVVMAVVYVSSLPKPKRVPIRVRNPGQRQR